MTGIILAGGKNKRMGQDKSFLKVGEKAIIERVVITLSKVFQDIIIISNSPELYQHLKRKAYSDIIPDKNSLGGIYTGLEVSSSEHNFFVACDMPFLNEALIRYMTGLAKNMDVVIPTTDIGFEPLHAIYSKSCIPYMKGQIEQNNLKIFDFFPRVKVREVGVSEINNFDINKTAFLNVNSKEDLLKAQDIEKNLYAESKT